MKTLKNLLDELLTINNIISLNDWIKSNTIHLNNLQQYEIQMLKTAIHVKLLTLNTTNIYNKKE